MQSSEVPKAFEEEETSLFKAEALSKETLEAISAHRNTKNNNHIQLNYTLVLPILAIILYVAGCSYYTEYNDNQISSKIVAFTQAHNKLDQSTTAPAKPDILANSEKLAGPATAQEDINFDLFDDDKKTTKKDNKKAQQTNDNTQPKVDQNNPAMKTYLEGVNKALETDSKVAEMIESMLKSGSDKNFVFPKKVWIYSPNEQEETLFFRKCIANAKKIAKQSGFEVAVVNQHNLQGIIPGDRAKRLTETLAALSKEAVQNPISGYEFILEPSTRTLVLLQILLQKGGIVMDKSVILTEDFSWLITIAQNQYANCGNPDLPTNYFAFHNVNFTSNEQRYNKTDGSWKFIAQYVGLEGFFLAGKPKGEFIEEVLKLLYIVYSNPQSIRETLVALKIGKAITNLFIVTNALPIACRIVLKQKQKLSEKGLLAIDYFGLKTINSYYFPKKLNHYFENSFEEKIVTNLAKYSLEELEETVGPLRYMAIVPYESYIDDRLAALAKTTMSAESNEFYQIHPESFLAKYIVPDAEKSAVMEQVESNKVDEAGEVWSALPKIIWTEQPANKKRNVVEWLIYQKVVQQAKSDGFEVREVNPLNLDKWLNRYEFEWIKNTADKAKTKMFNKMKVEIAKLHILIRYGGIWISKHQFALESFEWVRKITSYPSKYVFNRYGNTPSVLMYFHPHYGQPFQWTYDARANTKNMWHIALDSNFIAAQPEAPLLKDWVRTFTKFLTRAYNENLNEMVRLQVDTQRWTVKENSYFALLDAVKMVMANKQKELSKMVAEDENYKGPKSAPEFYKVWSISGAQGPLMLDGGFGSLSVEKGSVHPKSNTLIWRYPREYLQGIIGKVHMVGRLYHINTAELVRIISKPGKLSQLTSTEIHPRSFFYEQLYKPFESKISQKGAELVFV